MKNDCSEVVNDISKWVRLKQFNKRNKLPIIIVLIDAAILVAAFLIAFAYLDNSDSVLQNVANAGSESYAESFANQLKRSLEFIQENLNNEASVIESKDLTLEDSIEFIIGDNEVSQFEQNRILLLNKRTLSGYQIYNTDDGMQSSSFSASDDLDLSKKINDIDWDNYDSKGTNYTSEYWNDELQEYEILVYSMVEIKKSDYYLLSFISLENLVNENSNNNTLFSENYGVILNENGDVLYGSISNIISLNGSGAIGHLNDLNLKKTSSNAGSDETSDDEEEASSETESTGSETLEIHLKIHENLYEFIEKNDYSDFDWIKDVLSQKENGYFIATESDGIKYVYPYFFMTDLFGWVYINRIDSSLMDSGSKVLSILLTTIGLFVCFFGANMGIIFLQNSRLKRTLIKVETQNIELEKANKAQQTFISSMSHEIRTPINAVLGMDEMIIRESSEDEIRKYAYDIKSAGKSLLSIVNDILDFTKIQSGKMDIIPQDYDLASLINDLINLVESRIKDKDLELIINLNPDTPRMMNGDDIRIKQIITNILTNAAKYTEKGSVTFSIDYEKKDDKNVILKVAVKDTGIGIKPEEMDKLTKPFERLDEKKTRTIEGTGLGMSITTNLLAAMGSKMEVESVYGEGSNFHFELVQPVVDWTGVGPLDRNYREAKDEVQEGILHAKRAKILVVDDTAINLTVVVGLLKRTGVQVDTAESGFACLDMCKNKKYDVIFLDHRMPEMDGVETLEHLKKDEGLNKETPTIALTANAVSGAYEEYIGYGFSDFLSKPVNGNKLERMILKYLPEEILDTADEREIDDNAGLKACGSKEVSDQVRREFVQTGDKNRKELTTYLENGDIKNYTIKVHALKSTARLVGANELSSEALYLENCGNEGKTEEILEKTGALLEHHKKICEILKKQMGLDLEANLEIIDDAQLKEGLEAIKEFNESFDFDGVDSVISTLDKYAMPENFKESYEELKTAIYDVNQDRIKEIIDQYLNN